MGIICVLDYVLFIVLTDPWDLARQVKIKLKLETLMTTGVFNLSKRYIVEQMAKKGQLS